MESEEQSKKSRNLHKSFDVNYEKKIFSIDISKEEKEKKESIIFQAYEKTSVSNIVYTNTFNFDHFLKISKAFKMCDNFNEAFLLILQKFEENEVSLFLENDLQIIMEFALPNKKVDKIKLDLFQQKLEDSKLLEKLYANISYLQERNKSLEEEIQKLKPKNLVDLIGNTFKVSNFDILNDLYDELKKSDLEDEYLKEILNKFQSNIKTIFDAQKDGDTISGVISKVFGKTNLVGYISYYLTKEKKIDETNKNNEKNEEGVLFGGQYAYFDGKLEFEKGLLSFFKKNLFSYGSYGSTEKPLFTFFRQDNAKVFLKMGKNCVYFIATDNDNRNKMKMFFKVNDHFLSGPVFFENWNHDLGPKEMETISDEKFNELIQNDFADEEIFIYIKDFKIYQIDN